MAIRQNWNELWRKLRDVFLSADKPRSVSVLDNFRDSKESICRRMGIVSDADIIRMLHKTKKV